MRIGLCSCDLKPENSDKLFGKIKNLGFVSTQLWFASVAEADFVPTGEFEIQGKVEDSVIEAIKKSAKNHGVDIAACQGTFNMAHPDKQVRDEGIRRFKEHAEAVDRLGVRIISVCGGTRSRERLWKYHPDNSAPEAWSDMIDSMKRCVEIAEKYNITLAVETEAATVVDTPEKARKMMDEVGSANLKMIMDCANLFHAGEAKKENVRETVRRAFDAFGKDVVCAHGKDIAESDGVKFCPTGEGIIDYGQFAELLDRYGYKGDMLLHGIFDEAKMPAGIEVIKKAINKANK